MQTPAGKECKFFYGDYYRGRSQEECRLLKDSDLDWQPRLCEQCPVPEIGLANSCENMVFKPRLFKLFFFSKAEVEITTYCSKSNQGVKEPHIGCGHCHPALENFVITPDDSNDPN